MALDETPKTRRLVLDLFTEIAILEHLIRKRLEPRELFGLSAAQFGVINFFCRLEKHEERLSALAWSFQVEEDEMLATVNSIAARDLVTIDRAADPCVRLTQAGRVLHGDSIDAMAPDILSILAEFTADELTSTTRTLTELRRTFDNLPDR